MSLSGPSCSFLANPMSLSLSPICYYFAGKPLYAFRKDQQIWPTVFHAPCAPKKGQILNLGAVAQLRLGLFGSALVLTRQWAPPKTQPKSCSQLPCPGSQGTMLSSVVLPLIREQSRLLLAQITSKLLPAACWGGGAEGWGSAGSLAACSAHRAQTGDAQGPPRETCTSLFPGVGAWGTLALY